MTDFSPLCPPADPRARARSRPSGSCTSSTTTSRSPASILKYRDQLADRLAAQVHERQRLGEQHARVRRATARSARRPAPTSNCDAPRAAPARRRPSKPTLCRVPWYSARDCPSPTIAFIEPARSQSRLLLVFFLSSFLASSSSFLPFLMTSGSAGVAGAAAASLPASPRLPRPSA